MMLTIILDGTNVIMETGQAADPENELHHSKSEQPKSEMISENSRKRMPSLAAFFFLFQIQFRHILFN